MLDALNDGRKKKVEIEIHVTQNNRRGVTINHNSKYCAKGSSGIWWLTKREMLSVLADETKCLQKKEHISLVVCYHYPGAIYESFLQSQPSESLDPEGLTWMIADCLEKHGLDYKNIPLGQGYNDASITSGKHSSVSARITSNARFLLYAHCHALCLNLVLVDVVKSVPEADYFFLHFCGTCIHLCLALLLISSGLLFRESWIRRSRGNYRDYRC